MQSRLPSKVSYLYFAPSRSLITAGLRLAGASWIDGRLALNDGQPVALKSSQITWTRKDAKESLVKSRSTVNLPVYLNGDRSTVLFSVDLETDGVGQDVVAQRGVCLTAV